MSKKLFILFFLLISAIGFAQKKVMRFQHTFKALGMNGGLYVETTPDSGFVVCGQHGSSGAGGCDIYVYKRNKCGQIQFYKTYGDADDQGGTCIKPTVDGGLILAGYSTNTLGNSKPFLLKLDGNGVKQWYKIYPNTNFTIADRFFCVQQTADQGYIAAGYVDLGQSGYIVKTDVNGTTQWANQYSMMVGGNYCSIQPKSIEQTSDGGYIVIGAMERQPTAWPSDQYFLFLMKLSSTGAVQWCKNYDNLNGYPEGTEEVFYDVSGQVTSDGGYIVTSSTASLGTAGEDILVAKLDVNGIPQWSKTYEGPNKEHGRCIRTTKDGGYVLAGYTNSYGAGDQDAHIMRLDQSGNLKWSKAYGGTGRELLEGVRELFDGGFYADGYTNSFSGSPMYVFDVYSLKTDSIGSTGCMEVNAPLTVHTVNMTYLNAMPTITTGCTESSPVLTEMDYVPILDVLCEDTVGLKPHFTYAPACPGAPVVFTDQSTSSGTILTWNWDFGDGSVSSSQNPVHSYSSSATYTVTLTVNSTDACSPVKVTQTVSIQSAPQSNFTAAPVCLNSATNFTDMSTMTPPGTITGWSWDFGDPSSGVNNTSAVSSPSHSYTVSGTHTVTLVTTSSGGCKDTVQLPVTVNPVPTASVSAVPSDCGQSNGEATISSAGGTAPYSYAWSNSQTNSTATGLGAGNYTVTVTDNFGCSVFQIVNISNSSGLTATVTASPAACNASNATATVTISGGASPFTYLWIPSLQTTSTVTGLPPGSYSCTVTDVNGCSVQNSVIINSINGVALNIPSPLPICKGSSSTLSANVSSGTPSYTYLWFPTGQTTSSIIVTPASTSTYTIQVQDANGCSSPATAIVNVYPPPVAIANSATICQGQSALLSASGGGNYIWNNGQTTSSVLVAPSATSTYSVVVISIGGGSCRDTATSVVTVNPVTMAAAWHNVTITEGANATLSASGGTGYLWSNGMVDSIIVVAPLVTTVYCVNVADSNNCPDTACVIVRVEPVNCSLVASADAFVLPSAFSPNGDKQNDTWKLMYAPVLIDCIVEFQVLVYNRWGEQIFAGTDINFIWDGTYKGKSEETAVFGYYLQATLKDGTKVKKSGNLTLLR